MIIAKSDVLPGFEAAWYAACFNLLVCFINIFITMGQLYQIGTGNSWTIGAACMGLVSSIIFFTLIKRKTTAAVWATLSKPEE